MDKFLILFLICSLKLEQNFKLGRLCSNELGLGSTQLIIRIFELKVRVDLNELSSKDS